MSIPNSISKLFSGYNPWTLPEQKIQPPPIKAPFYPTPTGAMPPSMARDLLNNTKSTTKTPFYPTPTGGPISHPVSQQQFQNALGQSSGMSRAPIIDNSMSPIAQKKALEDAIRFAPQVSYTAPMSTPPTTSNNPLSGAFNALKNFASNVAGGAKIVGESIFNRPSAFASMPKNMDQLAGVATYQSPTTASSTPTLAPGADTVQTTTPPPQVKSRINDQYQVIANDASSDSATMQKNLEAVRTQDTAEKQQQLMQLQTELANKQAQLAAIQAGEKPPENQPVEGQPQTFQYNPEGQSQISTLSAQIKAMEDEIAKVQQDSPELQAATQALQKKIAEEQMIRANLTKGEANVAEAPINYSFISGQQAALQRQANADIQTNAAQRVPLQQQLANEQAKKQTAIDVVKTKYGGLGDERKRLEDIYKTNYNRANAVSDKYNVPFNLSAGQTRYDAKGNIIASVPANTKSTSTTSSGSTSNSNITKLRNALNASKYEGPEADGKYVDPNLYLANYNSYPDKAEFLRLFPPATYINPLNSFLPPEIMQFVKKPTSSAEITNIYR